MPWVADADVHTQDALKSSAVCIEPHPSMGTLRADEQLTLGKAAVTTPDLGLFLDRQCTLGTVAIARMSL